MRKQFIAAGAIWSVLAACSAAQVCSSGGTFLKNDLLPQVPSLAATPISVIQGLCDGEACGAVFDVSAINSGGPVKLNMAAVGFGGTASGVQAAVNLKVFDGITWSAGIPTMGPVVFDYQSATGANIAVTTTNINTQDTSLYNVVLNSGTMVVAWEMLFNGSPAGSCATGYPENFFTDNPGISLTCSSGTQKNLIFITGQGWRDASTAAVGLPLCPFFYNGNWVIRACVEPYSAGTSYSVLAVPNPAISGQTIILTFTAPGQAGSPYVAYPTFTTTPGLTVPGLGTLPVNLGDYLFNLYLAGDPILSGIFLNFSGSIGPGDTATALMNTIPGVPLTLYVGFVTLGATGIDGFSPAEQITIL